MILKAFKLTLLYLFIFPLAFLSATPINEPTVLRREFVKEINKSFPLNGNGRLELSNRHGQINIQSWDQKKVTIDIKIIVQSRDQEDANKVFERVRIDFTDTENLVTAQTQVNTGDKSWWDKLFGGYNSDDFKIIYEVKMPRTAFLKTDARYCNVSCGDLQGESDFYVKYGNLNVGKLGDYSRIEMGYGNINVERFEGPATVTIKYGNLDIDASEAELDVTTRYGQLRIEDADEVILDSRYTDLRLGTIKDLRLDGSYGDLRMKSVRSIRASTTYLGYEIGKVSKLADITSGYGDVEIDMVMGGFEEIRIKGSYSDIDVRMDPAAGYEISARTSYADIDVPSGVDLSRKESKSNSDSIRGTKKGVGNGKIDLSSSYGDIEVRE